LVVGYHHRTSTETMTAFTKWCPAENGVKTFENAEKALDLALSRLGQKQVALMQCIYALPTPRNHSVNHLSTLDHAWDYSDNTYLHNFSHLRELQKSGKIQHIGLTNTDSAHLELLINSGFSIATNQVSCSVIDRRVVRGRLSAVCKEHDVGILAYGTLLGGYLSEKWLGKPEPYNLESFNWSLRKYLRFIQAAGGWAAYQSVLVALDTVAKRHKVSIPAVATRFVLDLPPVKAVIVGTRLSTESGKYTARNLEVFSFQLSENDHALISKAQESLADIPGDCGDEYRRAPYLTASGDLSHHLSDHEQHMKEIEQAAKNNLRIEYSSGNPWESIAVCP
jgi:aryl-alcohol dehydrogenase-like predicted oxidoreductase